MNKYKIVRAIAESFNMDYELLLNGKKPQTVYFARYITVGILKEEGFPTLEILKVFSGKSRGYIDGHCFENFNALLSNNRVFKDMYLQAVKAVEDLDYESENESPAA